MKEDGIVYPCPTNNETDELLRIQLSELEMLKSMFPNPGELHLDDPSIIAHFTNYLAGKTCLLPKHLDFSVHLNADGNKIQVCVNLPSDYPMSEPEIFVRSDLDRKRQKSLNEDLSAFLSGLEKGDISVCSAVSWLQENASRYFKKSTEPGTSKELPTPRDELFFHRYWIYSHHIYNKTKRKEILDLVQEYGITGFCLPGKPGILCIEGTSSDCRDCWLKIKSLSWKKIGITRKEVSSGNDSSFRQFSEFKEISFECKGKRDRHMDFGEFHKFLQQHSCEYIFKEFFGIEGK